MGIKNFKGTRSALRKIKRSSKMKFMKKYFIFILFLLTMGCTPFLDTRPNFRTFVKGQIKIHAYITHGVPTQYQYAEIGYPRDTTIDFSKLSGILIDLPEGKVPLSRLTPNRLFSRNCFLSPVKLGGQTESDIFAEGEDVFSVDICSGNGKYRFLVTKNKIIQILIAAGAPLWNEESTKPYSFPMEYRELAELFGEPDGVYDWFTW